MTYDGIEIRRTSKFDLDISYGSAWGNEPAGTPQYYYVLLEPARINFSLFPKPDSAGTNNISVEYIKIPDVLTGDSSVPFDSHTILYPYHMAIAYWAAADLLRVQPTQEAIVMISQYQKQYDKFVSDCIETWTQMGDTTPMRMRGGRYFKGL
jgi:hypothetical protein